MRLGCFMKFNKLNTTIISCKKWLRWLFFSIFSLILFYLFLIMPNLTRRSALRPFEEYLFAHRGFFDNTCSVPENSLLAFQKAIDSGYGIELDVQLTKDKIPVVIHDYDLSRVSGEHVKVANLTFDELSKYRLFQSSESIPSLTQALDLIDGQVPVMIELKVGLSYKETCKRVAYVLKAYKGPYCIISFSPLALQWFKEKMPHVIRGQLSTNFFKDHIQSTPPVQFVLSHLLLNFLSRPDFISYNYKYASNLSLAICKHVFNTPIAMWTVRDQNQYDELFEKYPIIVFDGFIPSLMQKFSLSD